jgi:hypothetical protein
LRRISSRSVALSKSTMVIGSPLKAGARKASAVGSTVRIEMRSAVSGAGASSSKAPVRGVVNLLVDFVRDELQHAGGRARPRRSATSGKRRTGSRSASAARSAAVL